MCNIEDVLSVLCDVVRCLDCGRMAPDDLVYVVDWCPAGCLLGSFTSLANKENREAIKSSKNYRLLCAICYWRKHGDYEVDTAKVKALKEYFGLWYE